MPPYIRGSIGCGKRLLARGPSPRDFDIRAVGIQEADDGSRFGPRKYVVEARCPESGVERMAFPEDFFSRVEMYAMVSSSL